MSYNISKNKIKLAKGDYVYVAMLHEFADVLTIANNNVQDKTESGRILYMRGSSFVKAYRPDNK